jgi:hypothetical protein
MATYLIDYENVNKNGLNGVKKLSERDTVIIFVGNNNFDMPVETVMAIIHTPAQIRIKKMKKTADNYLDFQLATCLGGLISDSTDEEYFIISNDRDFESVIDYWKNNNASVTIKQQSAIAPTIETASAPATTPLSTPAPSMRLDNATKKIIRELVKGQNLTPGNYNGIYNLFMNESDKQKLHGELVRLFEQKKGSRLYSLLKDDFDTYNKST